MTEMVLVMIGEAPPGYFIFPFEKPPGWRWPQAILVSLEFETGAREACLDLLSYRDRDRRSLTYAIRILGIWTFSWVRLSIVWSWRVCESGKLG